MKISAIVFAATMRRARRPTNGLAAAARRMDGPGLDRQPPCLLRAESLARRLLARSAGIGCRWCGRCRDAGNMTTALALTRQVAPCAWGRANFPSIVPFGLNVITSRRSNARLAHRLHLVTSNRATAWGGARSAHLEVRPSVGRMAVEKDIHGKRLQRNRTRWRCH